MTPDEPATTMEASARASCRPSSTHSSSMPATAAVRHDVIDLQLPAVQGIGHTEHHAVALKRLGNVIVSAYFKGLEDLHGLLESLIPDEWLRREFEKSLSAEELEQIKSLGGLEKLIDTGTIEQGATVCVPITGSGLKEPLSFPR